MRRFKACDGCKIPDEQRLLVDLLAGYETASRPVFNASHTVTVKFGLTLVQISDMVSAACNEAFSDMPCGKSGMPVSRDWHHIT